MVCGLHSLIFILSLSFFQCANREGKVWEILTCCEGRSVPSVLNMVMILLCTHSGLAGSETSDTQ